MTNLKWHADQLNQISGGMKSPRKPSGPGEIGATDDGTGPEVVKRSRPNQLLRKLRNAQRHRQAEIARPHGATPEPPTEGTARPNAFAWSQRGVMLTLVPLAIVGMATLFVLGFIGSREVVSYMVGREYVPAKLDAPEQQTAEVTPSMAVPTPEKPVSTDDQVASKDTTGPGAPTTEAETVTVTAKDTAVTPPEVTVVVETDAAKVAPPSQDADVPPAFEPAAAAPVVEQAPEPVVVQNDDPVGEPAQAAAVVPDAKPVKTEAKITPAAEDAPPVAPTAPVISQDTETKVTVVASAEAEEEPSTRRDNDDLSEELKKQSETPAVVSAVDASRLIGEGHSLMASGKIVEARQLFTQSLTTGSAEAALALGRSFDPKHLTSIASSNAKADPAAARKWYEEWYRLSVEQGAISSNVRLERLLQAMNLN